MNEMKTAINDSRAMRWTILVMVSVLMFGTYWFQYFFSPLQTMMRETWGFNNAQFGKLVASTTLLNMFGGIIIAGPARLSHTVRKRLKAGTGLVLHHLVDVCDHQAVGQVPAKEGCA